VVWLPQVVAYSLRLSHDRVVWLANQGLVPKVSMKSHLLAPSSPGNRTLPLASMKLTVVVAEPLDMVVSPKQHPLAHRYRPLVLVAVVVVAVSSRQQHPLTHRYHSLALVAVAVEAVSPKQQHLLTHRYHSLALVVVAVVAAVSPRQKHPLTH